MTTTTLNSGFRRARATLVRLIIAAAGLAATGAGETAAQSPTPGAATSPLRCRLGGGETRELVLIFNEPIIARATLAVMLGVTDTVGQFHPPYGAVAFSQTERGLSIEFRNAIAPDWTKVPLVNDTYANLGGRYRFFDLKPVGDEWRGRFELRSNFVRAPGKTGSVPDVTRDPSFPGGIPEVSVTCVSIDLGLKRR